MGIEIERKFLLANDDWRAAVTQSKHIAQGYLVNVRALREGTARASVRVRISGEQSWLNIKSVELGIARAEYELPLPLADAQSMLATLCDGVLEKTRHHVDIDGWLFEIDEFLGDNHGLLVAEIELPATDAVFPRPAWLGREVSNLARYYNVNLIEHPFAQWSDAERDAADASPGGQA
ncbi:CYTH domain-containing protein [Dyella caseinilytica]|uniref:CYTH domain-containing protein n=1 Tax=Dyella caseinilytica TaxID=1849581 RepID=A0ABX7GYZ4_9GAMM|nr:CYTH domain-containing protein [Dyella caseinilytica]QRN55158.1 CYTH domain-containing protein [Dyella caseinilytica]GFZ99781.1 CYTH domain-containing protein [Dyella caseinilytica]